MKRGKSTTKDLERENLIAAQKLEVLKAHLSSERARAEQDALRAESLSNFGAEMLSVDPSRPARRARGTLPKFPKAVGDGSSGSPKAVLAKQQGRPKKVRVTYLKDEPEEVVRKRPAGVPLSEKLKEIQLGRLDNMATVRGAAPVPVTSCSSTEAALKSTGNARRSGQQSQHTAAICGQCEEVSASQNCLDCKEVYCSSCFSKFHQKGALRGHTSEPVQMSIVHSKAGEASTSSVSSTGTTTGQCNQAASNSTSSHSTGSSLLDGSYDEAAQSRSFQDAVMEWRNGRKPAASTSTTTTMKSTQPPYAVRSQDTSHQGAGAGAGTGVGGALWGEYDEEASAVDFARAVQEWRNGQSGAQPKGAAVSSTEQHISTSTGTSSDDLPSDGKAMQLNLDFGRSQLSYTERLMLQKHKEGRLRTNRPSECSTMPAAAHTSKPPSGELEDGASATPEIAQVSSSLPNDPKEVGCYSGLDQYARSEADALDLLPRSRPASSCPVEPSRPISVTILGRGNTTEVSMSTTDASDLTRPESRVTFSVLTQEEENAACLSGNDSTASVNSRSYRSLFDFLVSSDQGNESGLEGRDSPEEPRFQQPQPAPFLLGSRTVWMADESSSLAMNELLPAEGAGVGSDAAAGTETSSGDADHNEAVVSHPPLAETHADLMVDSNSPPGPQHLPTASPGVETEEASDGLQFVEGDLQVVDLDEVEFVDSDGDEERCLTELARELATAHGWRDAKDLGIGSPDTELTAETDAAEAARTLAAFELDIQKNIDADVEALRLQDGMGDGDDDDLALDLPVHP